MRKAASALRLHAPHPCSGQRVYPRGCKEEGDDGGVSFYSRHMQRGRSILQGLVRGEHIVIESWENIAIESGKNIDIESR